MEETQIESIQNALAMIFVGGSCVLNCWVAEIACDAIPRWIALAMTAVAHSPLVLHNSSLLEYASLPISVHFLECLGKTL
jgi:hypothetical protein